MKDSDEAKLKDLADKVGTQLGTIDSKVNDMRKQVENDPETVGDKLIKMLIPAVAAMIIGQLFKMFWNKTTKNSEDGVDDDRQGILMTILFSGLSAAISSAVQQFSGIGSAAFVKHRQHKRGGTK
ncbi:DUF4235 domain-containing protein [Bifidobacterium aquikefiricola]|uniref:DUF4235 domain-containing protein n=1 Tax=Bifidobacterium aquikefiricola TaxID=3059038 RepID=A0AB39U6T9_9BIFI